MAHPADSAPKVAIVILNFNGRHFMQRFLPSVYATTYPNTVLYIADNGSSDDSIDFLKKEGFTETGSSHPMPRVLIQLPKNYGFAGGYNRALQNIEADYYILLNSDIEVPKGWVEPLIQLMEQNPQYGACQPKIRTQSKPEYFEHAGAAGGMLDALGFPFCRGRIFMSLEKDLGQYNETTEIFWASGAALCIRPHIYHGLAGFDPSYFAHMEEIDLCWRIKRANYKVMYCPHSEVYHVGGGTLPVSSPFKTFLNFRNSLSTLFKNEPTLRALMLVWLRLLLDAVAAARFLLRGEFRSIWAVVKAHWSFFLRAGQNTQTKYDQNRRIRKIAYQGKPQFHPAGRYSKSIVWMHFIRKKNTFHEL